jgi:hypothetical protein
MEELRRSFAGGRLFSKRGEEAIGNPTAYQVQEPLQESLSWP